MKNKLALVAAASLTMLATTGAQAQSYLPDPVTDADYFANGAPDPAKVALGNQLFFDKILSGRLTVAARW